MTKNLEGAALRHVRTLFGVGAVAGLTDGQLLERFMTRSGEPAELAFAALVERHGPMVLRVCRRVLTDPHDAQDAFQATFLILVRRADSIRRRDSVASWLHGVAYRTASCVRAATARRRRLERRAAELATAQVSAERDRDDFDLVLHEELDRLPERYRAPIISCDLEGQTHEQASRLLNWPVGTVKSRLARGREKLRVRLLRRGLAPAVGVLGATFSTEAARPVVPAALAEVTARAAMRFVAGGGAAEAAGVVSARVAALARRMLKIMLLTKLKLTAAALLAVTIVATGVGVSAQQAGVKPAGSPDLAPISFRHQAFPATPERISRVAARVGDEVITLDELAIAVKEKIANLPRGYKPNRQEIMTLTSQVLDMLIERILITQEAKRELKKPEQMQMFMKIVDKVWQEEELPPLLQKFTAENEAELKEKLAEQGKSLDAMRESYRLDFLAKGYLDQKLRPKILVTLSEMSDYYNAHLDSFHRPERWTWREVRVEVDKHPGRAEARAKAEAVLARVRRGDDFAEVARAESEGPNRGAGGLWETPPDTDAIAAVREAVRSLPIGQVSTIIEGPSSYHVVRVEDFRAAGPAAFAEVQDQIRRIVHHKKVNDESNAFLDELRKQTVVTTIFDNNADADSEEFKRFTGELLSQ